MDIPRDDESAMNLTPMIDIVFNLVTFFLIATDLSHKDFLEVALPRAAHAAEDQAAPEDRRIVASVTADGRVHVRGRSFDLGDPDPVRRDDAQRGLERALAAIVSAEPAGRERPALLVRGDRDALWRQVQALLRASADPRVGIHRVQFAVSAPPADPPGGK